MFEPVVYRVMHAEAGSSEALPQLEGSARHGVRVVPISHGDEATTGAVCRVGG